MLTTLSTTCRRARRASGAAATRSSIRGAAAALASYNAAATTTDRRRTNKVLSKLHQLCKLAHTHPITHTHMIKPLALLSPAHTHTHSYKTRIFMASFRKMNFWSTAAKFNRTEALTQPHFWGCDTHTQTYSGWFFSLFARIPNLKCWKSQGKSSKVFRLGVQKGGGIERQRKIKGEQRASTRTRNIKSISFE